MKSLSLTRAYFWHIILHKYLLKISIHEMWLKLQSSKGTTQQNWSSKWQESVWVVTGLGPKLFSWKNPAQVARLNGQMRCMCARLWIVNVTLTCKRRGWHPISVSSPGTESEWWLFWRQTWWGDSLIYIFENNWRAWLCRITLQI